MRRQVPSDAIVKRFLDLSDKEKGVVSVHCKAGLGRTGRSSLCFPMSSENILFHAISFCVSFNFIFAE